jgi:hypothetical protein
MGTVFLDDFDFPTKKESLAKMAKEFKVDVKTFKGCEFIVAQYSYEEYAGSSFCLYKKDGVLYENYGNHCSCFGLEGQWEPSETTAEALKLRINADSSFTPEIKKILESKVFKALKNDIKVSTQFGKYCLGLSVGTSHKGNAIIIDLYDKKSPLTSEKSISLTKKQTTDLIRSLAVLKEHL